MNSTSDAAETPRGNPSGVSAIDGEILRDNHDENAHEVVEKRQRKQLLLRLDPAVHAALAKWAADDLRSVNAQIEVILRRSLEDAGRGVRAGNLPKRGRPARHESRES